MPSNVPSSFGRRQEPPPEQPTGPVMLPPVVLPPVQVPIVLVVDADSLTAASHQIAEMVTAAVQAGFVRALADIEAGNDFDDVRPAPGQLDHITG